MKSLFEHIEYVKGQPHHIRKKVVIGASAGIAGVIALVWLTGSFATGSFAISGSSFDTPAPAQGSTASSALAGAASALPQTGDSVPAHIEIVDSSSSTSAKPPQTQQTVIPF